jgi:hypothetical protein
MDQRTIGLYLSRILSGLYVFFYNNKKYKLIYPDITTKYESDLYAQEEYDKNKFNDWIQDENIIDTLVAMGLWNYNGDTNLTNIEKQIEDLKVDLYKNYLNPAKIKSVRRTLSNTKATYNKNYELRHSLDKYTITGYINELKNQYILINSIYDEYNNKIFNITNDIDLNLFNNLSYIISTNTIDISTFRLVSRNEMWRNYWTANSDKLFDRPTSNWTDEQRTLVVLTKMYDSAYQHPECPPDNVFEDDDIFDGWMITQRRENEKIKNKNRAEKMLEGKKLNNAGEVFVIANSQEEANSIYGLNNASSMHIIKERNTFINNNPEFVIEETSLPDVKRNMQIINNQQLIQKTRK